MKGGFVMPFSKENVMRDHIGQDDISGFLAEGTEIKGEIHFKDILRVDGKVSGKIVSEKPVEVKGLQWTVTSDRLEVADSGAFVRFDRGVTMTLMPMGDARLAGARRTQ